MHILNKKIALCAALCFFYPHATSENLGKTHFIIGVPHEVLAHMQPSKKEGSSCCAYFAPDDNLQQVLCSYIDQEQEAIDIAIYSFTNKHIAEAIINAYNRGVTIRLISDPSWLSDNYSKIHLLQTHGIPIHVYNVHYSKKKAISRNIMHHKFIIFKKNKDGRSYVWTGSYNFTRAATLHNQENALIISKNRTVRQFQAQFERLLGRCRQFSF
jgi:phosphatidylserine/phosphatidylglycerophosphate/cardiolipin synthase-like enzyme